MVPFRPSRPGRPGGPGGQLELWKTRSKQYIGKSLSAIYFSSSWFKKFFSFAVDGPNLRNSLRPAESSMNRAWTFPVSPFCTLPLHPRRIPSVVVFTYSNSPARFEKHDYFLHKIQLLQSILFAPTYFLNRCQFPAALRQISPLQKSEQPLQLQQRMWKKSPKLKTLEGSFFYLFCIPHGSKIIYNCFLTKCGFKKLYLSKISI